MTNIIRHAQATRVDVILRKLDENILLSVEDNGLGIMNEQVKSLKSIGIIGMRERLLPFNGIITFRGEKNKGTLVKVVLPIFGEKNK